MTDGKNTPTESANLPQVTVMEEPEMEVTDVPAPTPTHAMPVPAHLTLARLGARPTLAPGLAPHLDAMRLGVPKDYSSIDRATPEDGSWGE